MENIENFVTELLKSDQWVFVEEEHAWWTPSGDGRYTLVKNNDITLSVDAEGYDFFFNDLLFMKCTGSSRDPSVSIAEINEEIFSILVLSL